MVTDFKYRSTPLKTQRINWMWLVAITIIILQSTFIFYKLFSAPPIINTDEAKAFDVTKETVKEFKFYYILPNNTEYIIPNYEVKTQSREIFFGKGANKVFSLQVGAFKGIGTATRLQQRLVRLGFTPNIDTHTNGHSTWHRVMLSQLSILDVKANKEILKSYDIDSIVIESTPSESQ